MHIRYCFCYYAISLRLYMPSPELCLIFSLPLSFLDTFCSSRPARRLSTHTRTFQDVISIPRFKAVPRSLLRERRIARLWPATARKMDAQHPDYTLLAHSRLMEGIRQSFQRLTWISDTLGCNEIHISNWTSGIMFLKRKSVSRRNMGRKMDNV